MLLQSQVKQFLSESYKSSILSQLPNPYIFEKRMIKMSLKLDLARVMKKNCQMARVVISNYPGFLAAAQNSIEDFIEEENLQKPEHGVYLSICISNCPIPTQNIKSPEFQLAGFEQPQGIMIYLKDLLVLEVGQTEMFVFSCTEVWETRCECNGTKAKVRRNIRKNLINIIQDNVCQENKLKTENEHNKLFCETCQKTYLFSHQEESSFSNCQKVKVQLPYVDEKETIFQSRELTLYGETSSTDNLCPGKIVSCCAYMFLKPILLKAVQNHQLLARPEYSAYLINSQIHSYEENLLTIRPSNSSFFYEIGGIGLTQKYCANLIDNSTVLFNYEKLGEAVDKFRFAYLPPSMLTTLKLSLLNSACNHHLNKSLHLCLIVEDLQLALRLLYITGLEIKRFPSEYDNNTLYTWLKSSRGGIVIVVNPTKKDIQFLEMYFASKLKGFEEIRVTFWVVCETNPKKDINIDHFGIVLDLTTEKNIHVCKEAIEESIDLKMSAFVNEDFDSFPTTIARARNPRNRIEMIERRHQPLTQAQLEEEEAESKRILQSYYLKSRDLKKTSEITLSHMFQLAQGFSYLRAAMNAENWMGGASSISILDSVLSIFLEEESARNKVSNSNTIFGAEISKLILNEDECEISFWDYVSQEDGTVTEKKNYMPKNELFKKMLVKLNSLLFEEELLFTEESS